MIQVIIFVNYRRKYLSIEEREDNELPLLFLKIMKKMELKKKIQKIKKMMKQTQI